MKKSITIAIVGTALMLALWLTGCSTAPQTRIVYVFRDVPAPAPIINVECKHQGQHLEFRPGIYPTPYINLNLWTNLSSPEWQSIVEANGK